MSTYYYCKATKSGKITKPKSIVADTAADARKIIKDNNPTNDILFFENIKEYDKMIDDIKEQEDKRRQEKLNISANARKVWSWLQDSWGGTDVLTEDAIDDWQLKTDTDKPYYITYCWESGGCGHFATKDELIRELEDDIMGDWDNGSEKTIIEVETLKKIKVVLDKVSFIYVK